LIEKSKLRLAREATRRHNPTWLLYRAAYWHLRATEKHDGHVWIAKDRKTWMTETDLTRNQFDRALAWLKCLQLVVTHQYRFGKRSILHLRLTALGQQRMGFVEVDARCFLESEKPGLLESEKPSPYTRENTDNLNRENKEDCVLSHADLDPVTQTEKSDLGGDTLSSAPSEPLPARPFKHPRRRSEVMPTIGHNGCAKAPRKTLGALGGQGVGEVDCNSVAPLTGTAEGQSEMSRKAYPPRSVAEVIAAAAKPAPSSLGVLWVREVGRAAGKYAAPVTAKQAGQLEMFAKACPQGRAREVLASIVEVWSTFIAAASSEAGAFNTPAVPDPGFLLKFVNVAVNLWLSKQASLAQAAVTAPMVTTPIKVATEAGQAASPAPVSDGKASLEEITDMLNNVTKKPVTMKPEY
jgi:hypothetical protein